MAHARFITFEGGEGTGKSTQARRLASRLEDLGQKVLLTREPGGAPVAEKIRALILDSPPKTTLAELLLFAAARAEHIAVTIRPALDAGQWVICDRYIDSTRVYQGHVGGADPKAIAALERMTAEDARPALTLVLDVPVEVALKRALERGAMSRFDAQSRKTHEDIRAGFAQLARAEPGRCALIDASGTPDAVAAAIWHTAVTRLKLQERG